MLYNLAEFFSILGVVVAMAAVVRAWRDLPDQIPIRFRWSGEPSRRAGKASIVVIPMAALAIWAIFTFGSGEAVRYWSVVLCKLELIWLFAYLTWRMIQVGLGRSRGLGKWDPWIMFGGVTVALVLIAAFGPH